MNNEGLNIRFVPGSSPFVSAPELSLCDVSRIEVSPRIPLESYAGAGVTYLLFMSGERQLLRLAVFDRPPTKQGALTWATCESCTRRST